MTPRKTSAEISALVISQLETAFSTTIPILPKAFNRVLAKVIGGIFVLLYEYAGFILLQLFIKTATDDEISIGGKKIRPLSSWGELVGIKQTPGVLAELNIQITVLSQTGTLVSGTTLINTSTQKTYQILGNIELNFPVVDAVVRCTEYGEIGNVDDGSALNFVSPPASVSKSAVVYSTEKDGVDEELVEDFRDRIIQRWAARPQGGAYADYWDWAMEVPGVKNVYPYSGWDIDGLPNSGSGTVVLFVESEAGTDGIPSTALREEVLAYIQANESGLADRRPINAYTDLSLVMPITRIAFGVTIGTVISDDVSALRADITEGLSNYFLDREPWITGLSIMPRKDIVSVYDAIGIVGSIASSSSSIAINVSLTIGGVDVEDYYQLQEGEKAKLSEVTWI